VLPPPYAEWTAACQEQWLKDIEGPRPNQTDIRLMRKWERVWSEYRGGGDEKGRFTLEELDAAGHRLDQASEAVEKRGWCFSSEQPTAYWHWHRCQ
jgi:hypothetical protein